MSNAAYVNVEETPIGELLALLPDEREAAELETEMDDAVEALLQLADGAPLPARDAAKRRLDTAADRITAAARRALMDGTAALVPPRRASCRSGSRLSPEDKLDLLPPFTAAPLRTELRAAFNALHALPTPLSPEVASDDYLEAMFRTATALSEIDFGVARALSAPAN